MSDVETKQEEFRPVRRSSSLQDFCERHTICRRTAYNEIAAGRLKIRKVGRRSIVTDEAEEAWLAALPVYEPERNTPCGRAA
jgi:hypothetical protein